MRRRGRVYTAAWGSCGRGQEVGRGGRTPEGGGISDAHVGGVVGLAGKAGPESLPVFGAGLWGSGPGEDWNFSLESRLGAGQFCLRLGGEGIHPGGRTRPGKPRQEVLGLLEEASGGCWGGRGFNIPEGRGSE